MKKGLLEKIILSGLGLASLTQEKAQKLVDELVREGELSDKDAAVMAKRVSDNFEKNRKEMEKKTEKTIMDIMAKINVVGRKDFASLEKKIEELGRKIDAKK